MYHIILAEDIGTPAGNPRFAVSSHETLAQAEREAERVGSEYHNGVAIVDDQGRDAQDEG